MRSIFVLEEQTIGKIAAGEVVDRPASVVKELIENSIDAGSSRVVVEVGNGGRDYIRVTDDGYGLSEDDVAVAFEKHATSKIKLIEDLTALKTLGFRGEALPSIAAVSRIALSTRHAHEDFGTHLTLEGGVLKDQTRITRGIGTTLEVKSLFYNLPARIGTLKSKTTELRHIVEICINYAVIYPEIKFELIHDGNQVISTVGTGNMLDAIVNTFGSGVAKELIELKEPESSLNGGTITGYISKPAVSYGTKKHLFTYVNRRFVKSDLLDKAIKRGYMSLLPKHAYPFVVVSLSVDPNEVNVNIHPKKHEISFYHANEVFQYIVDAVSTTLRNADLIPEVVQREEGAGARAGELFGLPKEKKAAASVQTAFQGGVTADEFMEKGGGGRLNIRPVPLYQVLDSYIIAQSDEDDVIMIDQHAAAERINYERLLERYGGRIDKQALLRPYMPELSPHQLYVIRENEDLLRAMGFDIELLGDAYIIRAIPVVFHSMIDEDEITEVILQLVEERGKKEERLKVLFSTAACKASIKAGEKQSYESMRELVERLKATKLPYTCPHGRPTMIRLSKKEIEKRFKRR
ncbi:MAG TPA: DNA mismatch repair endonuclease MutL [Desulfobacteria bacterium]|nr:DNA mismatch repair endonuclease MutL [Desulfobacteria bacterium]